MITKDKEARIIADWRKHHDPIPEPETYTGKNGLLVACGCSTTAGMGCVDEERDNFAARTARALDMRLVNLAKGAGSNFHIAMQVKSAIAMKPDLVLVTPTTLGRLDFMVNDRHGEDLDLVEEHGPLGMPELTARNFVYDKYPPYNKGVAKQPRRHPFEGDPSHDPFILSDTFGSLDSYLNNRHGIARNSAWFAAINSEPTKRIETAMAFYAQLFDLRIKNEQDMALMLASHYRLGDIRHLFVTGYRTLITEIPDTHVVPFDWTRLAFNHGFLSDDKHHPSSLGHEFLFDKIVNKIADNRWTP